MGKTVMLGAAEDLARRQRWAVVSESATKGVMGRIDNATHQLADELGEERSGRRVTALTATGFGISIQLPEASPRHGRWL